MDINRLDDDLNIISQLSDEPNSNDGLSAEDLKARFDKAGNVIKNYINDTLVPDLEREIAKAITNITVQSGNMPSGGSAGQVLSKRSNSDFDWEFLSPRQYLPNGGVRNQVLVKNSDTDFDVRFDDVPLYLGNWTPLWSSTTPGTHTWTAPDIRDGKPYEIGVFIIGAGGSGGVAASGNATHSIACSGGAAGQTQNLTMTVRPGETYPVTVGAGGARRQITNILASTVSSLNGLSGGNSSFHGRTAIGGGGGHAICGGTQETFAVPGASGGQGSDAASATQSQSFNGNAAERWWRTAPSHGEAATPQLFATSLGTLTAIRSIKMYPGGRTIPYMCRNPFTGALTLAAGGGCGLSGATGSVGWQQNGLNFGGGQVSGGGVIRHHTNPVLDVQAHNATSPGSGGGAGGSREQIGRSATSGAGADGGVLIYVREAI